MAFQFTTQMQGPVVPINLYQDSAAAGISAGKALPSTTTAIIQGGLQGIQAGISIAQDVQNLAINQNKINQLPITNQIQLQALENSKKAGALTDLKLDAETKLHDLQIDADTAKLNADITKLEQAKLLREKQALFEKKFAEANPLDQKKMVQSGLFNDVFANTPEVYRQAITTLAPHLTQEEREAAQLNFKRAAVNSTYNKKLGENQLKLSAAEKDLESDEFLLQAADSAGLPLAKAAADMKIVAPGMYVTDPEGNIEYDDATGKPKLTALYSDPENPPGLGSTRDLKVGDRIVARGVGNDTLKRLGTYRKLKSDVDGTNQGRELDALQKEAINQKQRSQVQQTEQRPPPETAPERAPASVAPRTSVSPDPKGITKIQDVPLSTPSREINVSENPKAIANVQDILGLPDKEFTRARPHVEKFLSQVEMDPDGFASGSYSPEQVAEIDSTKTVLSRYTAGKEFDTNEGARRSVTDKDVETHNSTVKQLRESRFQMLLYPDLKNAMQIVTGGSLEEVKTPRDLYVLRRSGYFNSQLTKAFDIYRNKVALTKQALLSQGNRGTSFSNLAESQ